MDNRLLARAAEGRTVADGAHAGAPHVFDATILREYDIRGIVGETLTESDAEALGRAYATLVRRQAGAERIALGRDGRLSSPTLSAALTRGLTAGGLDVIDIGEGPTPMLYFAVHHLGVDGGIMVTGSHNPPDYNGFKMMIGKAPLFGEGIRELGRIAAEADWKPPTHAGGYQERSIIEDYLARLLEGTDHLPSLSVVWDPGNGAAGVVVERLAERLAGRHRVINARIDGHFPNHHPDPTVESNLEQLKRTVAETGADLGLAFDGDGDRIGAIDGHGRVIWGDQILLILARHLLEEQPGATIIADVKASRHLFEGVRAAGGSPLMWKTGHSLIKTKMAETGAPLAGEMSGHIFIRHRYYGYDDALYAA
ncbi:MAG: phosphomannomutase/phosphoglucomutase, partial [Alphaproteobacteria bacterium]